MDRELLKQANDVLLEKRKHRSNHVTPISEKAKHPKCAGPLKPLLPDPNPNWPPPSLQPVQLGSNLARWEGFDWQRHPALERGKPAIVDWYNDLPGSGALVLTGNYGCGKTHIAEAIADLYGRWRLVYFEEVELAKAIQHTYDDPRRSEEDIWAHIFRADLLILDDLGSYQTHNREWLLNLYNRVFNDYVTVRNKPILITTNLSIFDEGLEARIGPRSFSRLCDSLGSPNRYVDLFPVNDFRVERFLRK